MLHLIAPIAVLSGEDADGVAELVSGHPIADEVARRLTCDASFTVSFLDDDGVVVGTGRSARPVPAAVGRQVRVRDRRCRFPGCDRQHFVHIHHLHHWAKNGLPVLANLCLLCTYHHHLVHEGGWLLEGDPRGELTATSPTGARSLSGVPPGMAQAALAL